jgi:hypothetical protein
MRLTLSGILLRLPHTSFSIVVDAGIESRINNGEIIMLNRLKIVSLLTGLLLAGTAVAQAPANAPAGSTGLCRDGSYWTGATKKGACHGHKGVQDWYGGAAPAAAEAPAAATPAGTSTSAPSPGAAPASAPSPAKKSPSPPVTAAPGGGADKVWVNSSSKVYHCPSDRWYGKTKNGSYMSEADAIAQGNRADHGKACSK